MGKARIPVTIAVPAFNADKYLADAIQSLLVQTYTDFEMIISDNASVDHTEEICRDHAARDKRITYLRNPVNVGANRNFCNIFAHTRGKYLLLASDHDLWRPDMLKTYLQEFKHDDTTILAYSPATIIAATGEVLQINEPDTPKHSGKFATFFDVFSGAISSTAICGLILVDALQKTSIHTSLGPDTLLLAELSLHGSFCQIPLSHYFRRQNRPPESRKAAMNRYVEMLFENPHDIIRTMPYEHMLYKALCMVQNNSLSMQEQQILNVYLLDIYTRSWGVSKEKFIDLIHHMKDRKQPPNAAGSEKIPTNKISQKQEKKALDMDMFIKSILNTSYNDLAQSYEAKSGLSAAKGHQISNACKKWPTGNKYDVCYILYDTSKWGGVKGTLVQINGLVDRGYKVCLVSKSGPPAWFPLKSDFINSPNLSPSDVPASDIVIGTWYPTVQIAYNAQRGIAVHYCRGYEAQAPDLAEDAKRKIEAIYRLPTVKIANSPHIARLIKDEFGQQSYVVRNDINHEIFFARQDKRPRQTDEPWRVLIVGPYEIVWKGIINCISACHILLMNGYKIEIERASQTPLTSAEAELTKEFAGRFEYHCNLDESGMADLYNRADLFLSGSHPRVESFGRPAMEALACGLPAVLTDIPAYRDYDPLHDYALFVEPDNEQAMADAAARIIMDNDLRLGLISRGLEVSKHYSNKQTLTELEAALKDIFANHQATPAISSPASSYYGFSRPDIQALVSINSRRILDIGCAAGKLGADLKRSLGAEVWGIEPVECVAREAERALDRVLISPAQDALINLPDSYFDTIICADVLEHMEDPEAFLSKIKHKLTAGGELIASIPNVRHWSVVLGLLEGRWDYEDAGILDRTHLRFFTRKSILELFQRADLRISAMSATQIQGKTIPDNVVQALGNAGIDNSTINEESSHYQYLVKAGARSLIGGQVSIVILTYNELRYTKECVESVMKHTPEPHEIIFVDNASTDGTVKWLKQLVKKNARYRLIENEKNLGFSKGCNQGINASSGEYILLLNNDVVVTEYWLSGMLECLQSAPDIGIVGPMTNSISGPQKVGHVEYSSIEQLDAYAQGFRERNRHRKIPLRRIVGFCMLFRRSLVDKIGLLDESFGSGNFEDDDYCLRATLFDYRNAVAGDVFIHHYGSRSFVGNAMDFSSSLSGNRKIFAEKWSGIDQQSPLGKKLIVVTALDRAWDFHHRGQADEAATTLLEGIKHAPDERSLYYLLAELLMDSKLFKDAIDVLNQLLQDNSDVRKITLMGYCKEGLELYEEAGTYAKQALSPNRCSAAALNLSGILEFKQGARNRAESFFHKAIEADPGYGEPYTNLGVLKWAAEQHEDALSLLERGFTLSPLVMDIVTTYHTAVTANRSFARAESAFRAAKVLYPLNKRIAFLLIDVLLQQEQFDQAMNEVEQAISTFGIDDGILSAALNIRSKILPSHVDKPSRTKHSLSLCMIVKNEERHLPKCLMSVKALVDEMIIIDTGSGDRTRDIAKAFGAQVYDFPWTGDFDKARNFSLSKAGGDWILILDADEVLSPNDHPALLRLIAKQGTAPASYSFVSRNYILPTYTAGWTANDGKYAREEAGTGWIPSSKVRLFPRDNRIRFDNPVHELVEPSLRKNGIPIKICDIPVHHYGKLDPQKYTFKGEEYYLLGRKKLEEMGENADALRELAIQAAELRKYDESLELWQRALNLQPDMVLAYVSMASAYLELGNYSGALASSIKSFALAPDMKEAVYNYALCELYAGNVARTIEVLEELETKISDYPSAKILLVLAYCCDRNKAKGVELFWKLQKMNINFAESVHKLGRKLVAAGRIDYAVALLDMAIETNNVNDDILNLREACRTTTVNQ